MNRAIHHLRKAKKLKKIMKYGVNFRPENHVRLRFGETKIFELFSTHVYVILEMLKD